MAVCSIAVLPTSPYADKPLHSPKTEWTEPLYLLTWLLSELPLSASPWTVIPICPSYGTLRTRDHFALLCYSSVNNIPCYAGSWSCHSALSPYSPPAFLAGFALIAAICSALLLMLLSFLPFIHPILLIILFTWWRTIGILLLMLMFCFALIELNFWVVSCELWWFGCWQLSLIAIINDHVPCHTHVKLLRWNEYV